MKKDDKIIKVIKMSLNKEKIRNSLKSEYKDIAIIVLDSIDSTNNEAKRLISAGKRGVFAVIANEQTAGRGRGEHSFYSPGETGIYMSLVTTPELPIEKAVLSTVAAAVAVCEAIESMTDKKPMIKWVNDIFVDCKKVCGILTESVSDPQAVSHPSIVTGIGINVSTVDFPDEIKAFAGSVNTEKLDRNAMIAEIINRLIHYSVNLSDEKIKTYYRSHSLVLGKRITFRQNSQKYSAKAVEIGPDCSLTVELDNGTLKTLTSGEISIKLK